MTFDPYVLIKYHLYLLQLENYQFARFWELLFSKGWFKGRHQRKDLVWTLKAKVIFALAQVLILCVAVWLYRLGVYMPFVYWWQKLLGFVATIYILDFFTPIFLSLAVLILLPFDFFVKLVLVIKAKWKVRSLPQLKIIGIAGSYGKTTMKEVLFEVLGSRFKVQATPESVNTPVGIARWILHQVVDNTQIIIVEMGEHYKGDVEELCRITKPDIAVVTGINEAHLERMGKIETVVSTIFEIVSNAKPGASIVLNADDKNVSGHYKEFVWPDHRVEKFQISNFKFQTFDAEKLVWKIQDEKIGEFEINLLGEYALADVDAAVKIGQQLGMTAEQIKQGIAKIKPVEHRLQPIKSGQNILVIDDSYNGNPDGVREAVKVLSRFVSRRKIYITPGLVETGKSAAQIHREIGWSLAKVADVVILIKNSVTPHIAKGLKEGAFHTDRIVWFDTAQEAHAALGKILQPWDVVLFQNDWGDQYL